jgi:predicted phage-related endonuclease
MPTPLLDQTDIQSYCTLKQQIRALTDQLEAVEGRLKEAMGDATEARVDGVIVRYQPIDRRILDTTRLKAELPDITEMYTKIITARQFTVRAW